MITAKRSCSDWFAVYAGLYAILGQSAGNAGTKPWVPSHPLVTNGCRVGFPLSTVPNMLSLEFHGDAVIVVEIVRKVLWVEKPEEQEWCFGVTYVEEDFQDRIRRVWT